MPDLPPEVVRLTEEFCKSQFSGGSGIRVARVGLGISDLKFFGTATSADGKRRAFLLKGEDVFLASDGDIVQRRYRIVTVSANSILVEDMANNNRQTLPMMGR